MRHSARLLHRLLEITTISLLAGLAALVVGAVLARYLFNSSLPWYDEVASVALAWITYFGAALATLRRAHLGFAGFVLSLSLPLRRILFFVAELITFTVFVSMAYAGMHVLRVMKGETLVSLEWVPLTFTQSIVPLGCALVVLAQIFSMPDAYGRILARRSAEDEEIEQEIERAQQDLNQDSRGPGT